MLYNDTHWADANRMVVVHFNDELGVDPGALDPQWKPFTRTLTGAEAASRTLYYSGLRNTGLKPFGPGAPLQFTGLLSGSTTYSVEREGLGIALDLDAFRIDSDHAQLLVQAVRDLGHAARFHLRDLACTRLWVDGFTGANGMSSHDGTTLISTSHPYALQGAAGSSFYSNRMTAKLSRGSYDQALKQLRLARTRSGLQVNNDTRFTVHVSATYLSTARDIFMAPLTGGGNTNTAEPAEVVHSSFLDEGGREHYWGLFASHNHRRRPIAMEVAQAPRIVAKTDPQSERAFFQNQGLWKVDVRAGVAAGEPYGCVLSDGTTAAL